MSETVAQRPDRRVPIELYGRLFWSLDANALIGQGEIDAVTERDFDAALRAWYLTGHSAVIDLRGVGFIGLQAVVCLHRWARRADTIPVVRVTEAGAYVIDVIRRTLASICESEPDGSVGEPSSITSSFVLEVDGALG